jgi:hypothetical protein
MENTKQKSSLALEIEALEERLRTLPDQQFEERIEIRKKLIEKLIDFNNSITLQLIN